MTVFYLEQKNLNLIIVILKILLICGMPNEIILIDVSDGSNKQSQNFLKVVNFFIENCHLPITVGSV